MTRLNVFVIPPQSGNPPERKIVYHNNANFKSMRISRTAAINIAAPINIVFPLFGAFEERKWARGWNPELIYPETEIMEVDTTFRTLQSAMAEKEFIWRVIRYEPENHLVQYLVSTVNRFWTISVCCRSATQQETIAEITYTFIGLNETGNQLNQEALEAMYWRKLDDWREEIEIYLSNSRI